MSENDKPPKDAAEIAQALAAALDSAGHEYAIGGAIALGYWSEPRGTLDVDVTLFIPPEQPSACVRILQQVGCDVRSDQAIASLTDHGFCQVEFGGRRIDVFLPTIPFYELARTRRRTVVLGNQPVKLWDPETLCVFKMMFFRRKDVADVEQLVRVCGKSLNRQCARLAGPAGDGGHGAVVATGADGPAGPAELGAEAPGHGVLRVLLAQAGASEHGRHADGRR